MPNLSAEHTYTIRELIQTESVGSHYALFMQRVADYYALEPQTLYRRLRSFFQTQVTAENANLPELTHAQSVQLTPEQLAISESLKPALGHQAYFPALLHGVTGSGKTEIYKQLMHEALTQKKSCIFLVPEVSLAVQFTHIFKQSFTHVFGFHSATSASEKKQLWQAVLTQTPIIVVGVHLPILLPIQNLGLIIIDEEHDVGFQEKKHPRINSKEAALIRAQIAQIPIVLGSATPSISSLHAVNTKGWHLYKLEKRFAGAFPTVKVVSLKPHAHERRRAHFWISHELLAALKSNLEKKEQSIVFINRRGHSFFMQCTACTNIITCASCSVSLTVHEDHTLRCHYCNHQEAIPQQCPMCKAPQKSLLSKGIGTQQVVTILQELLSHARIARADLDSTVNKKKWQATLDQFRAGEIDILVGTQTITKGYHFPKVTLVGMLWADINLGLPQYNAREIALQQIIQVAGRAGRQSPESLVIIQTMLEHDIYNYLSEKDYTSFYEHEIAYREELHYPPCYRLAELELRHEDERIVEQDALTIADAVQQAYPDITVLGPAMPPVHKVNNIFLRKILIKSPSIQKLLQAYRLISKNNYASHLFFTPQPQQ